VVRVHACGLVTAVTDHHVVRGRSALRHLPREAVYPRPGAAPQPDAAVAATVPNARPPVTPGDRAGRHLLPKAFNGGACYRCHVRSPSRSDHGPRSVSAFAGSTHCTTRPLPVGR
jgi:hypothetical protein